MPVYKKLNEIIASGQLGRLNLIQVNFGSYKDYNMTNSDFSVVSLLEEHCLILEFTHFLLSAGSSRKHQHKYRLRTAALGRQKPSPYGENEFFAKRFGVMNCFGY